MDGDPVIKPMLAISSTKLNQDCNLNGYIWSGKVDGFRITIQRDHAGIPRAFTRSMKLHPNRFVQEQFAREDLLGLDGELVCEGDFHKMGGELRRAGGEPDVIFWVFDCISSVTFLDRIHRMRHIVTMADHPRVKMLNQYHQVDMDWGKLNRMNAMMVCQGFEGMCGRLATSHYREGRSGKVKPELIKVKDFIFSEATIVGYFPLEHNENPKTINELGQSKRSHHKSGKVVDMTRLGGLVLKHPDFAETFHAGSGFTHSLQRQYMSLGDELLGLTVQFKYQGIGSTKDRPRSPIFIKLNK